MTKIKGSRVGMAKVEGTELYYEIAGDGPPLVLAHAGFVDRRMWDEPFPAFAQHYSVLRYDRRGFGNSKLTPGPFSHRRDLHGLLNFLGIERAHLLGCSAGGEMAIDFTLEHPEMTASLTLVSSALSGFQFQGEMPKPMQELGAAIQNKYLERAAEIAVQLWVDGPKRSPNQVDARLREKVREMSRTGLPNAFVPEEPLEPSAAGRLEEIKVPTLVILGELDDDSIKSIGEVLATQIPGAKKVVILGAAHLPSMDKPEEFDQQVLEFLGQKSRSHSTVTPTF